jgi:5-methylcytosine-specific restriction endonuclease McrA
MARLKAQPPRLSLLKPKVAGLGGGGDQSARRDKVLVWRGLYKTKAWQRLRWAILKRDRFTCSICQTVEHETAKLVADHIKPHRGDERLFWDEGNLQTLCKACHDGEKRSREANGRGMG